MLQIFEKNWVPDLSGFLVGPNSFWTSQKKILKKKFFKIFFEFHQAKSYEYAIQPTDNQSYYDSKYKFDSFNYRNTVV